ncbi:MAG TPA: DUF3048 domain-containing protein [Patescibacteria group bacterium]|nr:DUF3048 domain-containing protein [Patescibacteria group bacterium]
MSSFFDKFLGKLKQSQSALLIGAFVLLAVSAAIFYLIFTGKTRANVQPSTPPVVEATSTVVLVPRRLDGVLVPEGQDTYAPRAVMVENHPAARPLSGVAKANVVIESPVEGGITRFLLLFDATTTADEVGPVRSARPYFVDWARSWNANYFHVGGSPEALDKIRGLGTTFDNIDEMTNGRYYWRSTDRLAPHNAYTSSTLMTQAISEKNFSNATMPIVWHFQDVATSTKQGSISTIKILYGGSYNVTWKFDKDLNVYTRYQTGQPQLDKDGTAVQSENVIVIKTDAQVVDSEGRLKLRTVGSGDAVAYRDGNKYPLRWTRANGETLKFESTDGTEYSLDRGRTWIEVTTDDRVFAGLEAKP